MHPSLTLSFVLTLTVSVTLLVTVRAYKKGPPINDHPQICADMSPFEGHPHEPERRPVPFALTSSPARCYKSGQRVIVTLATTNNRTYFEGFFVQARLASSLQNNATLQLDGVVFDGTFDTNGDVQLQALTCGNHSTNNSLGHQQAKRYNKKVFAWTPSKSLRDTVQFVATVVHERDEYWMRVTSPSLRYDESCSAGTKAAAISLLPSTLALVAVVLFGLRAW